MEVSAGLATTGEGSQCWGPATSQVRVVGKGWAP